MHGKEPSNAELKKFKAGNIKTAKSSRFSGSIPMKAAIPTIRYNYTNKACLA
jgi:hypothetical protein